MTSAVVTIENPERMNLLGLMLGDIIGRNLGTPAGQRAIRRLRGAVVVGSGLMTVTLRFDGAGLAIARDAAPSPAASVRGSLETFVGMATGGSLLTMVAPVLCGKLRIGGNPMTLLRMRPLLRT